MEEEDTEEWIDGRRKAVSQPVAQAAEAVDGGRLMRLLVVRTLQAAEEEEVVEQVEAIPFLVHKQVEQVEVEQVEVDHHILEEVQEQLILVAVVAVLQDHQTVVAQVALV